MAHEEVDKIGLETLQRHYAEVAAWIVRLSRYHEPAWRLRDNPIRLDP